MKKKLLFSLIGGVIIFLWQFLSFGIVNLHQSAMEYSSSQDEILQKLEDLGLEEGMYFLGQPDPSLAEEEKEEIMKNYGGKPYANLHYKKDMSLDMVMPMIRGILVDIVIAWFLFWLFLQQKDTSLKSRMFLSISVGLIVFLAVPYSNFIWFKEPDIFAYLLDGIIPWAILGFVGQKMAPKN